MANIVKSHNQEQYLDNNNHKKLEMQVLVSLRFDNGDFDHGFEKVELSTSVSDRPNSKIEIQLAPAPAIPALYQSWQDKYSKLVETRVRNILPLEVLSTNIYTENVARGFSKKQVTNFSFYECQQECHKCAEDLRTQVNQWLNVIKSQLSALPLDTNSEILLAINTENITSQVTKDILHRLPRRKWDCFNKNSAFEAVLCLSESGLMPEVADDGIFRRVRITSIFGDSTHINITIDKELIVKLQKRGAELIYLEQPQRQDFIKLWDEPCDILFYSGHSESDNDGSVGSLQINSKESLSLEEIKNTFQEAIKKGLQLAIFNSCDGLGLAKQLADLHLPYIIVWREPVPDKIAQTFLEYFLSSYAEGKSLFTSMQNARDKFIELAVNSNKQKHIPGLKWLPIICKNTSKAPPTWKDLGGLTGKLPNCPYQGLSAFREENKDFFFGRDSVVADLVEAVNSKSLVPVIGVSGSGKSSVVFAGLVPQLRDTFNNNVQIVSFRPGKNPFDALAVALKNYCKNNLSHSTNLDYKESEEKYNIDRLEELELEVELQQNKQALCKFIQETTKHQRLNNPNNSSWNELKTDNPKLLRLHDYARDHNSTTNNIYSSQRFVLIADQFEELYTLTDSSQRQPFLDALLYAVQYAEAFTFVLTLRSDFLGKALDEPMGDFFNKYPPVYLTPMKQEELQAAIEQPAAKMKVELESGLTNKLIDDLGNQPERLPLLQFTLSLLWEKHDKWYLTHKAYAEIGGLEKALAKYASGVLNLLSAADKEKAERIFIQLIRPGEGTEDTKRKATREEVGEDNWELVEVLANNRLVVTGWHETSQHQTVEIIHEALIREWGMLREWIKSNRQFRIWQERLQFTVTKWEHQKRNDEYLLSGGALGEAETWLNDEKYQEYLSNSQRQFIQSSLQARDEKIKEEKLKQQLTVFRLAGLSIISLVVAGFAGLNWVKADISATTSNINSNRVNSEYSFGLQKFEDALIEGIKGNELLENARWKKWIPISEKQKVEVALHNAINNSAVEKNTLSGHKAEVNSVKFSPDGKTIASTSNDKTVKLWSASDGKLLHTLNGHQSDVLSVEFSPDGKTIASASRDKTVKLWSASDGKLLHTLNGHKDQVWNVKFSPDGKTIASASRDKTVKLWSASDGKLLHTLNGHKDQVWSVEFSLDSKTIASASLDKTVKLWSASDGQLLHTLNGHQSEVWSVKFSPDGKTIASASTDKTVKLWLASDGQLLHTITGNKDPVSSVEFSPDGKTIAFASDDKTVKLWSASDGKLLHTISGHQDWVSSVKFSPDGKTIASASGDETVKLWNWNFDNLLAKGCNKIQHYLVEHPEKLQELKVCQNPETFAAAASTLVRQGKQLAENGDFKEAIENFKKAQQFDAQIHLDPQTENLDNDPEAVARKFKKKV